MRTLAVSAVKSNNSYVNFAGKNKKSTKNRAVKITAGAVLVAGAGLAIYKNKSYLSGMIKELGSSLNSLKINFKFLHLNVIKWLGS